MTQYGMSEPEAYHWIQRTAKDRKEGLRRDLQRR